jgi:fatty acyl-CoA reductase
MGKVFIEKMLRLTDVEKLYLLMRPKKGKNPKDRLTDIFANPVSFDILKPEIPKFHFLT